MVEGISSFYAYLLCDKIEVALVPGFSFSPGKHRTVLVHHSVTGWQGRHLIYSGTHYSCCRSPCIHQQISFHTPKQ